MRERKPSAGRDVAAEMAAMLEMSCAYIPEFGVTNPRGEIVLYMGNAILSAAPFDDVVAVPDGTIRARRACLVARGIGRGLARQPGSSQE